MRQYFLSTEWGASVRNRLRREVEDAFFNKNEWESEADFISAMYQKLYDCEMTITEMHELLVPKMPMHFQTMITFRDFASSAEFGAAVWQIQAGYSEPQPPRPQPRRRNAQPAAAVIYIGEEQPDSGVSDLVDEEDSEQSQLGNEE